MTFKEWWKINGRDFSAHAIPSEIKWFAEQSWNAAVHTINNKKIQETEHS